MTLYVEVLLDAVKKNLEKKSQIIQNVVKMIGR